MWLPSRVYGIQWYTVQFYQCLKRRWMPCCPLGGKQALAYMKGTTTPVVTKHTENGAICRKVVPSATEAPRDFRRRKQVLITLQGGEFKGLVTSGARKLRLGYSGYRLITPLPRIASSSFTTAVSESIEKGSTHSNGQKNATLQEDAGATNKVKKKKPSSTKGKNPKERKTRKSGKENTSVIGSLPEEVRKELPLVEETRQEAALEAAFELGENENVDWNNKQLCKISHRNLLLYAYNNLDMATVVKITNKVLAAYQTLPRRKKASQRRQYVQKFLRCIRKHKPEQDHVQLAKWMLRSIDLLTCHDLYSMLRVRHILNYDNSFETFRASFGIENFETFSNVRNTKEQQDKIMEEKALKNRTTQRNLLMKHLKINKFRFMKDHNVTKAVYEANIEWCDAEVEASTLDPERFAFIYNLPFIDHTELTEALHQVLTRFAKVKEINIFNDRMPPLTSMVKKSSLGRNGTAPPKDKYSPLYALVEFETKEDRNSICDEHIRIFGLICCGRVVYPELAERKYSILVALYPPFKRMAEALQFIANSLTESPGEERPHELLGDLSSLEQPSKSATPSSCKIMPLSKRRKGSAIPGLVTADPQGSSLQQGESNAGQHAVSDNHVDSSMLDKLRNKHVTSASMDPQWVVLRFQDFKHAYYARSRLMRKLADDPRSVVSFDTKRSIFHNGKYVDLPLFQYSTRTENDPSVARISQTHVEESSGYRSLGTESL